jgi:uncharacterized protein with HEPN domain
MANPRDRIYVEHIVATINLIESFVSGKDAAQFRGDPLLYSGAIRQLEIIGEASKRLSAEFKTCIPRSPGVASPG